MKLVYILTLIFGISFSSISLSEDVQTLNQDLNRIQNELLNNSPNMSQLLSSKIQLQRIRSQVTNCIQTKDENIKDMSQEWTHLKEIQKLDNGLSEKNKQLMEINAQRDKKFYCEYLRVKINKLQYLTLDKAKDLYIHSLLIKETPFITLWHTLPHIEKDNNLLKHTFQSFTINSDLSPKNNMACLGLIIIIFLKVCHLYFVKTKKLIRKLDVIRYLKLLPIFLLIAPIQYILLDMQFSFEKPLLLIFIHKNAFNILVLLSILYIYFKFDFYYYKKDLLFVLLHVFFLYPLVYACYSIPFLSMNGANDQIILFYRYLTLIFLQPIIYLTYYWMIYRIQQCSLRKSKPLQLLLILPVFIILIGSIGYLNLAVNLSFLLIINTILSTYIIIAINTRKYCIEWLKKNIHTKNSIIQKIFSEDKKITFFQFKALFYYIFIIEMVILISLICVETLSFIPNNNLHDIFNIIFIQKMIYGFNLRIVDLLWAFPTLIILNLINFAISNSIGKYLFKDEKKRMMMNKFFNYIGYIITFVIIANVIGFPLKNIVFIISGLSIGIGLGLKNILASFISSMVLFMNKPFQIGDYIEIGDTKGYVKKISLLETIIETLDNNNIILPNQLVASSIIQNYTYGQKLFYKIHITYILKEFNIQQEELINQAIKELLQKQKGILDNTHHHIKLNFSLMEETTDAYRLEIIFCIDNSLHIKEILIDINKKIFNQLQSFNHEVIFEKMDYPTK